MFQVTQTNMLTSICFYTTVNIYSSPKKTAFEAFKTCMKWVRLVDNMKQFKDGLLEPLEPEHFSFIYGTNEKLIHFPSSLQAKILL